MLGWKKSTIKRFWYVSCDMNPSSVNLMLFNTLNSCLKIKGSALFPRADLCAFYGL